MGVYEIVKHWEVLNNVMEQDYNLTEAVLLNQNDKTKILYSILL